MIVFFLEYLWYGISKSLSYNSDAQCSLLPVSFLFFVITWLLHLLTDTNKETIYIFPSLPNSSVHLLSTVFEQRSCLPLASCCSVCSLTWFLFERYIHRCRYLVTLATAPLTRCSFLRIWTGGLFALIVGSAFQNPHRHTEKERGRERGCPLSDGWSLFTAALLNEAC